MRAPTVLAAALILVCAAAADARAASPPTATDPSDSGVLTVAARPVSPTYPAYGQVQPVSLMQVRAVEAGTVARLALPGEPVRAGQVLAVLGGAQARSLLSRLRGAARAAEIQLAADRRKLTAHLVTRQTVAADEAADEAARGRVSVALQTLTLRAPAAGQVLAVTAADGEQVTAGELLLTLQTGRPLLTATYYGKDALAIKPGMTGRFQPVTGRAIPVGVMTVSETLAPDGGEQVELLPVATGRDPAASAGTGWRSGQWGTVTLIGGSRPMIAVPTRALILDRARWWVLVRTPRGDRRRQVVPGPVRGWTTYLSQGLRPGERVVVQNAYLEFHRGIARRYAPPD